MLFFLSDGFCTCIPFRVLYWETEERNSCCSATVRTLFHLTLVPSHVERKFRVRVVEWKVHEFCAQSIVTFVMDRDQNNEIESSFWFLCT